MKILFFLFAGIILTSTASIAQCEKKLLLTSSLTEQMDSSGTVLKTIDENSTVEISKTDIVISPGSEDHKITGPIKSYTCDWKVPFKEGKSVIKADLTDPSGRIMTATITITGKEGKVMLMFELAEMPDRKIRVAIDKFEEVK